MAPRKSSKVSTSAPRPLDAQFESLSNDKIAAIFKTALAASSSGRVDPIDQPPSPTKRKLPLMDDVSAPSTPSPKKKQVVATTPGTAVVQAMASLTAEDPPSSPVGRSSRTRVPSAKAAAALAAKTIIASGPKSSYSSRLTVKQEPGDHALAEAPKFKVNPRPKQRAVAYSPISLSSDDDDELPTVTELSQSIFVNNEAVDNAGGEDGSDSQTYEGTVSSGYVLDGFVVPDTDLDDAGHSDASNAARKRTALKGNGRLLRNTPTPPVVSARRAKKLVIEDEHDEEEPNVCSSHGVNPVVGSVSSSEGKPGPAGVPNVPKVEDSDGVELNVIDLPVMDSKLQDPLMEGAYADLPFLAKRAFIEPYGYDKHLGSEPRNTVRITVLQKYMSDENLESLFRALLFDKHGFYVNMARVDPSLLASSYRRLTLKRGGAYATCLMNGVVSSCDLVGPGVLAGSSSLDSDKFLQHRISIFPFRQEIVRDMAAIFQVLQLPATGVKGTYSKGGLAFVTRGQGKRATLSHNSGYAIPKEQPRPDLDDHSDLFAVDAVPVATTFASSTATKAVLEYDDVVPIYDGRAETGRPFRFDPGDFDDLPSWRLYMNNRSDLPPLSVVTVGYSTNWYTLDRTNPNAQRYLSTNVLFVIVLNTPSSRVATGNGSSGTAVLAGNKGKGKA
ncbi:hypothetical protein LshimejAT787_1204760 [Lyophyllum shimeji]|uniref:Uncharacterized protein n=1 Tax=Lyophyllum shimeji TaxID=47721 RepID=A0A9P3PUB0_LYOSH|nr:hypothetical protein LshimejAT787_1204760 [Lyophyllum shimeji]